MAAHIDTGNMLSPNSYTSKLLKHLGLVAGRYDELGIGETIDRLVKQDKTHRQVTIGQAIKARVLNGLGFAHRALYLTERFFQDKPVNRLIGDGIIENRNDFLWISPVPETLTKARDISHAKAPELMSHRAQRAWCSLKTTSGSIQQRWVVVYSHKAYQRALQTLNKDGLKQSTNEFKPFNKLCQPDFVGEADALKALAHFEHTLKMTSIVDRQVNALAHDQKPGRPPTAIKLSKGEHIGSPLQD